MCPNDTDVPAWKTKTQIAKAGRRQRQTDNMPFPPFFEWWGHKKRKEIMKTTNFRDIVFWKGKINCFYMPTELL